MSSRARSRASRVRLGVAPFGPRLSAGRQAGGSPPPVQRHLLQRVGLTDDTLETAGVTAASGAMTFLLWIGAIAEHDASAPSLLCWGVPAGTGTVDPGVMIRFQPSTSDRLEALIGRAGSVNQALVPLPLPGGATDITTLSDYLVWLTINGTTARLGIGDPAAGVVSTPTTVTGGVDTGSTTGASLFGRNGTTGRGVAATFAVGVVGEVLSDATLAAVAALGASGPASAVAAVSAGNRLWAPRPASGIDAGVDLVLAAQIVDAAGVQSHVLTAGTNRLKAA